MSVTTSVLVHGAGCTSAGWAPVARELALRGHRTVAVDLPGHGLGATVPRSPTAPSGMAGTGTARSCSRTSTRWDADESLSIDDQATRVDPARWGRIPHTYVRLTEDHALPLPLS